AVFGWSLPYAVALIGVPTVIYTMIGGVQAVAWVDVKQMVLIVFALIAVTIVLPIQLPVAPGAALDIAGATGRLRSFDFSFDLTNTYTFWSGIIGGFFLMMSYFGTDQSQVQRYLASRSVPEARTSLLMSAYWKIPLQALVLIVGVLIFVFYIFERPPLLFNPAHESAVRQQAPAEYEDLRAQYEQALDEREQAALAIATSGENIALAPEQVRAVEARRNVVRDEALSLAERVTGETPRDVNYIVPHFVLNYLPIGLAGLLIAAVLAAAMSSIAAELNSLATVTVIDFYRRWVKPQATDAHFLMVSKAATAFWGLVACVVATYAATLGSLIEVVNRFGSFFYGSILGVFLLAMIPFTKPWPAFIALLSGMAAVAAVSFGAPSISFLWHNVVGALTVVVVGILLSSLAGALNESR